MVQGRHRRDRSGADRGARHDTVEAEIAAHRGGGSGSIRAGSGDGRHKQSEKDRCSGEKRQDSEAKSFHTPIVVENLLRAYLTSG